MAAGGGGGDRNRCRGVLPAQRAAGERGGGIGVAAPGPRPASERPRLAASVRARSQRGRQVQAPSQTERGVRISSRCSVQCPRMGYPAIWLTKRGVERKSLRLALYGALRHSAAKSSSCARSTSDTAQKSIPSAVQCTTL